MLNIKKATAGRILAGVAVIAAGAAATGCSSGGNYDAVELQTNVAKLDPATESIQFPTSPYALSLAEVRVVNYATDLLIQECVRGEGLDVKVIDRRKLGDEGVADTSMGLWSMDRASKWGFSEPPPSALMQELLDMNAGFDDTKVQGAWTLCMANVDEKHRFDLASVTGENDLTTRARSESWDEARAQPEWNDALSEWQACIEKAGLKAVPDAVGQVVDAAQMTQEQQIRAAVADVTCKEETGLIQRLADIRASFEQEFVKQNQSALDEQRKTLDAMLADAQTVIGTHG